MQSFLLGKDAAWEFTPVSGALEILKCLLDLYWKGMSEPLHFFPVSSFEYVGKILLKNWTHPTAIKAARRKWSGSDFSRGESEDPYFERCFGKIDPLNKDFENILPKLDKSQIVIDLVRITNMPKTNAKYDGISW